MQGNIVEGAQSLDLDKKSLQQESPATSENLPKNVSMQLFDLMKRVVKDDVNPSTVRAACACATEIHRMLKLNLEIKKLDHNAN